ncbi:MAG: TfoX/Sxy family protein [Rhizobiales bacterium]|nr:TfoX/Sxy family protein [Hyphomicrobiales bacterium]MBI3674909.1 TfoX/Sxy family protein [Hyphomicrobiales bacterium]
MAASSEFTEFLTEQMAGFGPVTARCMFGGTGLFREGLMFALVVDEVLYFKTDEPGRAAFESEGLGPFTYGTKQGERVLASYWRAPSRCLDDADEMSAWCCRAHAVALAAAKAPKKRKRSSPITFPPR